MKEYYRANPDKFNTPAQRERKKQWCKDNAERVREAAAKNRDKRRAVAAAAKDRPCADCNVKYPTRVMEFDHVRGVKVNHVAHMLAKASMQDLIDEIAKCDVVCANCHRLRHIERDTDNETGDSHA